MPPPSDPPAEPFPVGLPPPLPPPGVVATTTAPWNPAMVQWVKDSEHLRLLSIGHYIVGGLAILFSCFFIIYIAFGTMLLSNPRFFDSTPPRNRNFASPSASPDETTTTPAAPTPDSIPERGRTVHNDKPPAFIGYMMVGIGSVAVLLGWTTGALLIYSGRCLAKRTGRVFSMVLAGISCLQVPVGTLLGVCTLIVLQRPTVQALYNASSGQK